MASDEGRARAHEVEAKNEGSCNFCSARALVFKVKGAKTTLNVRLCRPCIQAVAQDAGVGLAAAKKRKAAARQVSFVVAACDVIAACEAERDDVLAKLRGTRDPERTAALTGAIAAINAVRDRIEKLG